MASIVTIQVVSLSGCHLDTLSMESTLLGADLIDIVLRRYRKDNAVASLHHKLQHIRSRETIAEQGIIDGSQLSLIFQPFNRPNEHLSTIQ